MKTIVSWILVVIAVALTACNAAGSPVLTEAPVAALTEAVSTGEEGAPMGTPVQEPTSVIESEPGGREAVFPNTIIVVRRNEEEWTIYHTGRIVTGDGEERMAPMAEVEPLFELVASPSFWDQDSADISKDGCLDCPVYTLMVHYEGESKEIEISQRPQNLPEILGKVLDEIEQLLGE